MAYIEVNDKCVKFPKELKEECWECPELKIMFLKNEIVAYCLQYGRLEQEK